MPASTLYAKIEETIATEIAKGEYHPEINYLPKTNCFVGKF
jgi:DNA-binding GntR family transcriptional regulator